jgi:hypothetical protein
MRLLEEAERLLTEEEARDREVASREAAARALQRESTYFEYLLLTEEQIQEAADREVADREAAARALQRGPTQREPTQREPTQSELEAAAEETAWLAEIYGDIGANHRARRAAREAPDPADHSKEGGTPRGRKRSTDTDRPQPSASAAMDDFLTTEIIESFESIESIGEHGLESIGEHGEQPSAPDGSPSPGARKRRSSLFERLNR